MICTLLIADTLIMNTSFSQQLLKLDFFKVTQQPTVRGFQLRQINTNILGMKTLLARFFQREEKHKNPYNEMHILLI